MKKNIDFRTATPEELKKYMIETFSDYRKEFMDFLNTPMLVSCNSVVVVNNDNTLTIGVDIEKNVTKLNRGFAFPCTFTPKKAREIAASDCVKDGDGNILPLKVKNIAVFCREQIKACDDMLAFLA